MINLELKSIKKVLQKEGYKLDEIERLYYVIEEVSIGDKDNTLNLVVIY